MSTLRYKPIWACLLLSFSIVHAASAAGVVTICDEASLRAAMVGGGTVAFDCDGTITLASQLTIATETTLNATGHSIMLSGGSAVRLFNITPGASLTLMNLTLANGRNQGPNGVAGTDGGQGSGGAINVDNGTLNLAGCRIWTNTAAGGAGGDGNPNGSGGPALGGAIYLNQGALNATNSQFAGNTTIGGPAGTNAQDQTTGISGGKSWGGAIYSRNGQLNLADCNFMMNTAVGGIAPQVTQGTTGNSGLSGEASGGAWFNDGGTAVVTRCSFVLNRGETPQPIGPLSGSGGAVRGGSICNLTGMVWIADTEFVSNRVFGGQARRGVFAAGAGQGGAICNLDYLDVTRCLFQENSANGGNDGNPAGDGLGGAIFSGGQLRITQSEFQANSARAGQGYHGGIIVGVSGIARGGAVFATNTLGLSGSTFSGNTAYGAAGGLALAPFPGHSAYGGAIYCTANSYLTNNTLAGNVASGGPWVGPPGTPYPPAGGDAYGGGLYQTGGTAFLLNNTFAANAASGGTGYPNGNSYGGGIANQAGTVSLLNTIVANSSSGSNSFGILTDSGHNLSSDASCAFSAEGSLNNTDPKLGPLDSYGGPTPTMALLGGSPAIDGGDQGSFPPTDQRGRSRPFGVAPDIGAFESSEPYVLRGKLSGATFAEEDLVQAGILGTTTTNHGSYSFEGLTANTYSVTPSTTTYLMVPSNRVVTVGPDQLNVDFKAYRWNALSLESATDGVLHLAFAGTNGESYRVLASSNLVDWLSVSTNSTGTSNLFQFFDPTIRSNQMRFYRTASP